MFCFAPLLLSHCFAQRYKLFSVCRSFSCHWLALNQFFHIFAKTKNYMKHLLFSLLFTLLLIPSTLAADNKKVIKSVDLQIEVPQPNMMLEDGVNLKLLSANTAYGDLFKAGVISLSGNIDWTGEFGETDDGEPFFKPGYTYRAIVQIVIDPESQYTTTYYLLPGGYELDAKNFSGTINGNKVRLLSSTPYFPKFEMTVKVAGGGDGKFLKKEDLFDDYTANKASLRATPSYIKQSEADELWPGKHAMDVLVIKEHGALKSFLEEPYTTSSGKSYKGQRLYFITKAIVDVDNRMVNNVKGVSELTSELGDAQNGPANLQEIWLGPNVDAVQYVRDLNRALRHSNLPCYQKYWDADFMFFTSKATLCVPAKDAAAIKTVLQKDLYEPVYTIRTYTGDVYEAQQKGLKATQPLCQAHQFTKRIMSTDRVCNYYDCKRPQKWYYSCALCGKCEYNAKHTFNWTTSCASERNDPTKGYQPTSHNTGAYLATDDAYIGRNAAGEYIYWTSCDYCGTSHRKHYQNLSDYDLKMMGQTEYPQQTRKAFAQGLVSEEEEYLMMTTPTPGTFGLPAKAEGKMSRWAQDDLNRAASDNLLDASLLGNDFTLPLKRRQLVSIAERLAAEMTGKHPTADEMQLADGIGLTDADGIVSRQEMATYIRRTMTYIEHNSEYAYSAYDSNLKRYTDCAQLKEWAKEPMAFMEALELIEPTAANTLSPAANCTIEQALSAAERATLAHKTGWYQMETRSETDEPQSVGLFYGFDEGTTQAVAFSQRVWVKRWKQGMGNTLPVYDPVTKRICYTSNKHLHPVRWKGESKGNSGSKKRRR